MRGKKMAFEQIRKNSQAQIVLGLIPAFSLASSSKKAGD